MDVLGESILARSEIGSSGLLLFTIASFLLMHISRFGEKHNDGSGSFRYDRTVSTMPVSSADLHLHDLQRPETES